VALTVTVRHALGRITLDLSLALDGGLTALLGPSGAGKTSLLNVVAGLLRPDHGLVRLDTETLTDTDAGVWVPPHRRRIGYVFQDSRLFPHLTVRQNLGFGRWFNRRTTPATASLDDVVALLDLQPLLARHPARLSGGERRRVALGRALLSNPRLLLLDEPLGSLDAARRAEILPYLDRLLTELRLPMIYVTHDPAEVHGRATRTIRMHEGRADQEPSPADGHPTD
jgi:molybdate transport system ATP-binding protein